MMNAKDKRYLYKTAFSPMYNTYVGIKHTWQDSNGQFLFQCRVCDHDGLVLFRECELRCFIL